MCAIKKSEKSYTNILSIDHAFWYYSKQQIAISFTTLEVEPYYKKDMNLSSQEEWKAQKFQ